MLYQIAVSLDISLNIANKRVVKSVLNPHDYVVHFDGKLSSYNKNEMPFLFLNYGHDCLF